MQSCCDYERFVFQPLLREHANQPKGSEVMSGQRKHPKLVTTNAEEHLLSVRHTKLSPWSPLQPLGAWERLKVKGSLHRPNADWTQ